MQNASRIATSPAELLAAAADGTVTRIVVRGTIAGAPPLRLARGQQLAGEDDTALIAFRPDGDGLQTTSDSAVRMIHNVAEFEGIETRSWPEPAQGRKAGPCAAESRSRAPPPTAMPPVPMKSSVNHRHHKERIMRTVRLTEFGIENIRVDEVADPTPAAGEVLIAAEAATINPADVAVVTGVAAVGFPPNIHAPYTPGWDLAGRVVALGDGADGALSGARVVGFSPWFAAGHGTQASLVALPASNVAVAPDGLPSAQLTTVGLNGLTAWRALDELKLAGGETLVITGAAGSVGGFALELAVARGVRVIAAVRERDRHAVLAIGASAVATTDAGDLGATVRAIVPGGADALLDTASLAGATLGAIRDGGRYVTTTNAPESERGITVTTIYGQADALALNTLIEMATADRLHTPVARTFDVSEARAAYEEFVSGPHRGRIVLTF